MERIIGRYEGAKKGPLLICLGSVHGNEPAGMKALELMFKMLEVEPITNPKFTFRGRLLGLRGNLRAIRAGKRFLEKDLNRHWTIENVERIRKADLPTLVAEDLEVRELLAVIESEIKNYQPSKVVLLDLHTTTAYGGIFTVVTDDLESLQIGVELHAPVIQGLFNGVQGTILQYFNRQNVGVPIVGVCFESGQHQEELSINRAIAAITNCMRTIGCVRAEDVENQHDKLLIEFSKGLPKVSKLSKTHSILPTDEFVMRPGYKNFQKVKAGEIVADDKYGEIIIENDSLLLMPLYQKQGSDGFFLIEST
ncbi:MAG: succinylglutamate desuccinylase/aspartoacylase family protein, partial [Bacteroidota bacterium]